MLGRIATGSINKWVGTCLSGKSFASGVLGIHVAPLGIMLNKDNGCVQKPRKILVRLQRGGHKRGDANRTTETTYSQRPIKTLGTVMTVHRDANLRGFR